MPELEIANLYREFNRFGITVTSISHATKYAITDHYNPVETTHFVEMSQSLDVQSVELSLLHAQYMIDYPIVIGGDSAKRFKIQPLEARSKVIYPSSQFALWLSSKTPTGHGYFI